MQSDFLNALVKVCMKHDLSLGHEDPHGGFLVHELDEHNIKWLLDAAIAKETPWNTKNT